MAIARVGKRFGVFDIRIGLPRDKGFDPVEASKRINQRANPQTTVNKFRALVSSGEGLARSNKFIAVINFPSGVTAQTQFDGSEFAEYQTAADFTNTLKTDIRERLFFFCDGASMPGRTITDETNDQLYGPERSTKYTKKGIQNTKSKIIKKAIVQLSEGDTIDFYSNL